MVSIFGAMFAPKPFDVGEGDGARDTPRRAHRDGKLDSQRPDTRRADPKDRKRSWKSCSRGENTAKDKGKTSIPATFCA